MSFRGAGRSLLIVAIATALGLGFAFLTGSGGITLDDYPALFACAVVAFAVNWLAFIPSALAQKDTYYDTVGALTYLSVIGYSTYHAAPLDTRAIVVAVMVGIWTVRLGSFLFMRIHASGGADERFEKIKKNPPRFLVAWTLQAVWVILTASSALVIITFPDAAPLGLFFWAWSQHTNYFGEITLWTGILVMAIPLLSGWSWLAVISPIFVYLLLTRISGVNLLDGIGKDRWGDDPAYQQYRKNTPVLFPRPPKG